MASWSPSYRHLMEAALAFLEAAGEAQPVAVIASRVLGDGIARLPALARGLEAALAADDRFEQDSAGRWLPRGWNRPDVALTGETFVVVDVETTGGRTEKHRLVEVGAVRLIGEKIDALFTSLVRPERPPSRFVTELTGITPDMLDDAPGAATVLEAFRAFAGDAILVGHNVACDLTFLNYEAVWHGLPPFGNRALDTEELAVRLLPDLRRPSLARVAAALGLAQPVRHRALADARLTAGVLRALLARLDGITTFGQLQAWLSSRLAARQERVRRVRPLLAPKSLRALPERPGVYTFRDASGSALYVGKASSLRDRVTQHFTGAALLARAYDGLLDRTVAVEHTVVDCELEAVLLESARIRSLQPPFNVQARSRRSCPFIRIDAGPFPRASVAGAVTADGFFAGPYRTTQAVRQMVQTVRRVFQLRSCRRTLPAERAAMREPCLRLGQGLCPAPCAGLVSPEGYSILVRYARIFVEHGKQAALRALEARLADLEWRRKTILHVPDADVWELALLRECLVRLRRVRKESRPIEGGFAGDDLAMLYPAAGGGHVLLLVRGGQLIAKIHLACGWHDVATLERLVAQAMDAPPPPLDTDQQHLLLRWIYRNTGRPELIPLPPGSTAADVAAVVRPRLQPECDTEVDAAAGD